MAAAGRIFTNIPFSLQGHYDDSTLILRLIAPASHTTPDPEHNCRLSLGICFFLMVKYGSSTFCHPTSYFHIQQQTETFFNSGEPQLGLRDSKDAIYIIVKLNSFLLQKMTTQTSLLELYPRYEVFHPQADATFKKGSS